MQTKNTAYNQIEYFYNFLSHSLPEFSNLCDSQENTNGD